MNMAIIGIIVLSYVLGGAACKAAPPESDTNYLKVLERRAKVSWRSSEKVEKPIAITFFVADSGQIYNAQVTKSSDSPQADAECLEAICGLAPVSTNPNHHISGDLTEVELNFDGATEGGTAAKEIGQCFQKHPENNKRYVVFHIKPVSILERKISGITQSDLFSLHNLRMVPADQFAKTIKAVDANWGAFFERLPHPTKKQLEEKSAQIESMFPALLKP
ncbi:MAG TPA: hypothetical protein V6C76_13845 [Drouetiella sp.]